MSYTCGVFPRMHHRVLLCRCALVAFGPLIFAQEPATVQVTIKVMDQSSAPIPGARIRLVPAPDHPPAAMKTGQTGELALQLKPGGHALFTSEQGFRSDVRHIEISGSSAGSVVPVILTVGSGGGPVLVISEEEAAEEARELLLSAMPYHRDWWIKPSEFAAMPHVTVVVKHPQTGAPESYAGVRVSELLTLAGAPMDPPSTDIALRTDLKANDEVFSLAELMPELHEGEIIIADSMNGRPLDASDGRFMLVVSADKRRLRWVRQLHRLVLQP